MVIIIRLGKKSMMQTNPFHEVLDEDKKTNCSSIKITVYVYII